MKKIIIALALLGITGTAAEARSCKPAKKKVVKKTAICHRPVRKAGVARTAQVCREQDGYYTCCVYKNRVAIAR